MPIDPSIILQGKQPDPNALLKTAADASALKNALITNQSNQQTLDARQAVGAAYQGALDPVSGQLDTNKLIAGVVGDPRSAWQAGTVAKDALEQQRGQAQLTKEQADAWNAHLNVLGSAITPLLTSKTPLTKADVLQGVSAVLGNQSLSPQMRSALTNDAVSFVTNMPDDDAGIRQQLTKLQLQTVDAKTRADMTYGTPQTIDTGSGIAIGAVSPVTGYHPIGQFDKTLTPSEKAAPRTTFVNGQPGTVTTGSVVDPYGNPIAGTGFLPTGPKLGQTAAADVASSANAQQGVDLQRAADTVPTQKSLLDDALGQLKNFSPGPNADLSKTVGALAAQYHLPFTGDMAKGAAAQEIFTKVTTQIAQQQFGALGGTGTDSKLESAMHTSPNQYMTKLGNEGVIALLKGNADAIAAKNSAWQKWLDAGHGPETYGKFSQQFNQIYNPTVFQLQYLTPEEQKTVESGMSKTELAAFQRSQQIAQRLGWTK